MKSHIFSVNNHLYNYIPAIQRHRCDGPSYVRCYISNTIEEAPSWPTPSTMPRAPRARLPATPCAPRSAWSAVAWRAYAPPWPAREAARARCSCRWTGSVLGGNASSEVRMWICGRARRRQPRDRHPRGAHAREMCGSDPEAALSALWDSVLYGKARYQGSGCSWFSAARSPTWRWRDRQHLSGARLAPRAPVLGARGGGPVRRLLGGLGVGAPLRRRDALGPRGRGRVRGVPRAATSRTVGPWATACLIQLREIDPARHQPFIPPPWAHSFPPDHPRLRDAKPARRQLLVAGGRRRARHHRAMLTASATSSLARCLRRLGLHQEPPGQAAARAGSWSGSAQCQASARTSATSATTS